MKTKMIAFVEIAIVLCSLFLVALPAIAAEQNQEMQEVSANTITTASEDDYVLGIYGNANEDDTIDMRDLTYVKLIFFGKKPETELADAKYDGKINPLDFIQIKLIIVGKEKELTIVQYIGQPHDITEEPVTVKKPIERIVVVGSACAETICAFGSSDGIVGVDGGTKKRGELRTLIGDKPLVAKSSTSDWDMEKILEQEPDIVLTNAYKYFTDYEEKLNAAGIPLVQMDYYKPEKHTRAVRNTGWMLSRQERAENLINFEQQHINLIKERVKDLTAEQKPRVYFEVYRNYLTYGPGSLYDNSIIMCGGINIFDDIEGGVYIDPEAVLVRKPQIIFKTISESSVPCGYDVTDTGPMEECRNDIMSRPGWDGIEAVKSGKVYILSYSTKSTHASVFHIYIAKWMHPELFEDINPVAIHEEWFERFLGIKYKGVYAYPTYPVS